jgi:hypothetical protein
MFPMLKKPLRKMNDEAKIAIADEISNFVLILKHLGFIKKLSLLYQTNRRLSAPLIY